MTGGRRPAAPGDDGWAELSLADLSAIRRCDVLLDLAARRRLDPALAGRDPAFTVLSVLAADVDGTAGRWPLPVPPRRPRRATVAAIVASALAALVQAVVAAGTTSLLAASILARLSWPGRDPGHAGAVGSGRHRAERAAGRQ